MLYLNLIHRPEAYQPHMLETLQWQIDAAHRFGLKVTNLISFNGMNDPRVVELVKRRYEEHGDEPGIHFHSYQGTEFQKIIPIRARAFWGNTRENKRKIVDLFMETFQKHFGFLPSSLGSYYFDAPTLAYIKENYPTVECVIATCFQEGSVTSRGTGYNWYFFNEGGPWWPWYPSARHVLCPAAEGEENVNLVAIPHLCRDMLMSVNDRNDYFASHPGNLVRGKTYNSPESRYDLNLIEQYAAQERYNDDYAYYTIFVSLPWLMHDYEEASGTVKKLYLREMEHLAEMKKQGRMTDMTMTEFARWFRANRPLGKSEVCYWQDILCGSGREVFWQISPGYRACVDGVLGGALCELTPYAGRLDGEVGADAKSLWMGSYPFLMNAHKRGSSMPRYGRASILSAVVSDGTNSANLANFRTTVKAYDREAGLLTLDPIEVPLGSKTVQVQQQYIFKNESITVESKVLSVSDGSTVELTQYMSGCVGHTEFPEDIRGVTLAMENAGESRAVTVQYLSKEETLDKPRRLSAKVPQLNIEVSFVPVDGADQGLIGEEFLFSPYFNLALTKKLNAGGKLTSCLTLKKL